MAFESWKVPYYFSNHQMDDLNINKISDIVLSFWLKISEIVYQSFVYLHIYTKCFLHHV